MSRDSTPRMQAGAARVARSGGPPLRVAEFNRQLRTHLETELSECWVEGELSDVTRAASGHVYFTLRDSQEPAQVRGVIFRGDVRRARAKFVEGERIRIRALPSLYEPKGLFQLIARIALPAGDGDLKAMLELIKRRLGQEGWLDPARKRPLPKFPATIGVVTSLRGAALHDILSVLRRRFPVRVVVSPCQVQGPEAPTTIVTAFQRLGTLQAIDVVIVGRGGGSNEDLHAFNDERVARAVAMFPAPVISAVGHEVDFTIVDLVADVRAATPSNAAELAVPELATVSAQLAAATRHLQQAMEVRIGRKRLFLERLQRRLPYPAGLLHTARQRLQEQARLNQQLARAHLAWLHQHATKLVRRLEAQDVRRRLRNHGSKLAVLSARAHIASRTLIPGRRRRLEALGSSLRHGQQTRFAAARARLRNAMAQLDAMSPLAVLGRGYAIVLRDDTGQAVLDADDLRIADSVSIRVHRGSIGATVTCINAARDAATTSR